MLSDGIKICPKEINPVCMGLVVLHYPKCASIRFEKIYGKLEITVKLDQFPYSALLYFQDWAKDKMIIHYT